MPRISHNERLKRFKRSLLNNVVTQAVFAALLAGLMCIVFVTSRKQRVTHPDSVAYLSGEKNALFAFWHGRMMMLPLLCPPKRKMHVLISRHRDGLLISRVISHFGQATIAGSSGKDGASAVKEVLRAFKKGENVSITPDGPRGPYQSVSEGTIVLAQLSGMPIVPMAFSSSRMRRFKSWDRFCFALPFGRLVFIAGAPFYVARDATSQQLEEAKVKLAQMMSDQALEADRLVGVA